MKILQLVAITGLGGTGASVSNLSKVLADAGYQLWVGCYPGSKVRERLEGYPGINLITNLHMPANFSPVKFVKDVTRLAKLIKKEGIEVIHSHSSPDSHIATLLKILFPRLVFIRSRHVPLTINDKLQCSLADAVVAVSYCVKGRMGLACAEKAVVIYDGFNSKALRNSLEKSSSVPVVRNIARYSPVKGLEFFLRAIKAVNEKMHLKAFVVGRKKDDGNRYYKKILDLRRRLGLENVVFFKGFVDNIAALYADSDVVTLTSIDSEGSSRVSIEALHFKVPVVAHKVCSIAEIVVHGKTGLLVEPGDWKSLAKGYLSSISYPALKKKLRVNCEKRRFLYSNKMLLDKHLKLYQSRILGRL
ncbi:glycosyltransferase [Thermosulfidibacter takaii]|uniref:glycosyltransferase n=1 Tax=Thermosulfidibacter takaii TaxID=412593 RepID=UPI000839A2F2|nr:glycosyltransferase [Thermosulfidibacter takaii]